MTRYEASVWAPGPPLQVYVGKNAREGVILHSAEGYFSEAYRPRDTMEQRGVSWHFTVFKDGRVEQHYDLDAVCWHAGTQANLWLLGVEHEGEAGEPLTPAQTAASVALVRWLARECGWANLARSGPSQRLYEHREVNLKTTCPNGRIPWAAYEEEDVLKLDPVDTQSEAIELVKRSAFAVGPDGGQWFEIKGGYTPKPGYKALLVEVKED